MHVSGCVQHVHVGKQNPEMIKQMYDVLVAGTRFGILFSLILDVGNSVSKLAYVSYGVHGLSLHLVRCKALSSFQ